MSSRENRSGLWLLSLILSLTVILPAFGESMYDPMPKFQELLLRVQSRKASRAVQATPAPQQATAEPAQEAIPQTVVTPPDPLPMATQEAVPTGSSTEAPAVAPMEAIPAPVVEPQATPLPKEKLNLELRSSTMEQFKAPEGETPVVTEPPLEAAQPVPVISPLSEDAPFSQALKKMEAKKQQREQEAAKYRVQLPSQGGSISNISPSLSRLNAALHTIIHKSSTSPGFAC